MDDMKEWILNLILDALKGTATEKIQKEELDKWLTDFMNTRSQDLEEGGQDEELVYQSLFEYIIKGFRDLSEQKQENLIMSEEAVAGKRLFFRYIFLYKNEENRILYLRAAALLKNERRI